MDNKEFPGRLVIQQRVLPSYRANFLNALGERCRDGLFVIAGEPQNIEQINTEISLSSVRLIQTTNYHFKHPDSAFYFCWQKGIREELETLRPDAVVVEANSRYLSTYKAIGWMKRKGIPILGWGLGAPSIEGFLSKWRERWRANFFLSFDAVISYSRRGASEYQKLGFPAELVFSAPNAVSGRPDSPIPKRSPSFTDRPNVIFVGRLQTRKRIDNLLSACASLPLRLQPELFIIGDGPELSKLQSFAEGVYPHAVFTGAKYGSELDRYYRNADLFVLPGTGGLAVQQALPYGLPVIVAEGDGTQEDMVNSQNGWLVPANDVGALEKTLRLALSDAGRLREMGRESYLIAKMKVNIENMVGVFLDALTRVVG